ncbi:Crp/Fnr family transcriptional regulator [Myroides odoratimimus]|uniref:Crp/Fnr family transcriptional regulator n=1 Tax=Myroides odoratimimus TaxID=76832 RepID=UPI001CE0DB91|nr:Crp/Fnr family transcriptional regulator [Myroides odoratimimus]MCA4807999.1 Crp/Fnr family transcriptional regulator [Myroides odoratimimus]MDM1402125.1 Crp/Fnr family transcriptional regulator [Myroides odoratimimus]MDM1443918.1 Crp/Fnr family transcriptional regulator [Myroides odoratimimus]MDM1453209.1 Crp/Fnr family transcriptional regulator [Myroides odoratimimus]MDM1464585.1 Crp/Fnr family transcriptional regulator [Myroides odoratimimus]
MLLEKLLKEFEVELSVFTSSQYALFDEYFERITISKNEHLIKEGEVEQYSYFIYEGIFRCWTIDPKGVEQTFWFCKEGTFSMSNISFSLQERADFSVQAVMDAVVYRINKEQISDLYASISGLEIMFGKLTARLLNRLLQRNIELIKYSSEEYYLRMQEEYGLTFNYIPLKDIASYLGITPQGLSRIRKRIF